MRLFLKNNYAKQWFFFVCRKISRVLWKRYITLNVVMNVKTSF